MTFAGLVERIDRVVHSSLGGEAIAYDTSDGPPVDVIGIFDERYILADGTAEAGVETVGPAAFFRIEDLPDVLDDDPTLTIRSVSYRVIERRPDGMGGVVLALRRIA
jgi:hypothetical protein